MRRLLGFRLDVLLGVLIVVTLLVTGTAVGYAKGIHKHPWPVANAAASTGRKMVYLTFDDGPGPNTAVVLHELNAAHAHATFFEIGNRMPAYQGTVTDIIESGDVIGDHSETHPDFTKLGEHAAYQQWHEPYTWMLKHEGYRMTMARYPYGHASLYGNNAMWASGLTPEWWNLEAPDWNPKISNAAVNHYIMRNVRPGFVLGLHDEAVGFLHFRQGHTPYLPELLRELKAAGYHFGVLKPGQRHPVSVTGSE
jgi:peptidoglycan-N-acetylglucosamine deacetylase